MSIIFKRNQIGVRFTFQIEPDTLVNSHPMSRCELLGIWKQLYVQAALCPPTSSSGCVTNCGVLRTLTGSKLSTDNKESVKIVEKLQFFVFAHLSCSLLLHTRN